MGGFESAAVDHEQLSFWERSFKPGELKRRRSPAFDLDETLRFYHIINLVLARLPEGQKFRQFFSSQRFPPPDFLRHGPFHEHPLYGFRHPAKILNGPGMQRVPGDRRQKIDEGILHGLTRQANPARSIPYKT